MRKILFLMLGILMFSCNKEDVLDTPTPNTGSPSEMRFSGVKRSPQIKGVAQLNNLWRPGSTITIKFLDGDEEEQESVKNYAKEWLEYANIKFKYVTDGDALVRISFKADRCVSWSYTGSDCKIEQNQNKPTANLDAYEYLTENEKKADVLRLFGQILGLELEHRHLDVDPKWRPKLESYWTDNFEDIPWESLKKYVYDPLLEEDVDQTEEFDDESIMLWQFPTNCTLNSSLKYSNFKLSENDIKFIGDLYPFEELDLGTPLEIINVRVTFGSYDYTSGSKNVRQGYYYGMCGSIQNLEGATISNVPALFSNSYGGGGTIGVKGMGIQAIPSDYKNLFNVIKLQMVYNGVTTVAYRFEPQEVIFGKYGGYWNDLLIYDQLDLNPDGPAFIDAWYNIPNNAKVDVRIEFYNVKDLPK